MGEEYVVNESHILSLKMTKSGKNGDKHQTINGVRYFKDDIVDICVTDYLKLPNYLKETLKGTGYLLNLMNKNRIRSVYFRLLAR